MITESESRNTTLKDRLKSFISEFANSTTAHGPAHIASSTSATARLIWLILILLYFVACFVQIGFLVSTYKNVPVKTNLEIENERSSVFPAVTFCNVNIIKKSLVQKLQDKCKSKFSGDIIASKYCNFCELFQ